MRNISLVFAALTLMSFGLVSAQSPACKAELREVFERVNNTQTSPKKMHSVKIEMHAVAKDSLELEPVDRTFSIYTKGKRVLYESSEMSIFTDENYVANVLHEDKTVYLSKAAKNEKQTAKLSGDYLNKAFLNDAEVKACKPMPTPSCPDCHMTELVISKGALASRGITAIRYHYDTKAKVIKEVRLTYSDQVEDAYTILKYLPATTTKAEASLDKTVHSILFSSGENFKTAYHDYKLVKTYKQ